MSKGRGSLFALKSESATDSSSKSSGSSGPKVSDSGIGSTGRGGARGKLFENLAASCSNMTISAYVGRGRACLLQKLDQTSNSPSPTESISVVPSPISSVSSGKTESVSSQATSSSPQYYRPVTATGTSGAPVRLATNYMRIDADPNKGVFIYDVKFNPNIDSMGFRMKLLHEQNDKIGEVKIFDGSVLYLPILLENKISTFTSINANDNSNIQIKITFIKRQILKDSIYLYNILFDRVMKALNYVRFDRKQFDPTAPKMIPQAKLEVWPGYVTAVNEYDGGLMLCCDISHRLLCQKTVLETLVECYHGGADHFQENAKKALLGSVIITRYNNKTYRIDDVAFDKNPLSTFDCGDTKISYVEYYRKHYNIEITEDRQPLLISFKKQRGAKEKNAPDVMFCLVPEICHLTGLRDDLRSDQRLMREIATFTRVSPNQRLLALKKFHTNINQCPEAKKILSNWGLTLKDSTEFVSGRQLEEEQIIFGKRQFSAGYNADFGKYATNNEMLEVVHVHDWLVLHCRNDFKIAKSFIDNMERNAPALGVTINKPKILALENDRTETFVTALRNNINKNLQIVVIICPTSRDDRYAAIKKICCAEHPIPSQVINARTLANPTKIRSIVQKIALQINCKLGGSLWTVKIPFKNVMICGIDTYHDAAQKGNSVSAFVASLNANYTKWYSKAVIQTKREEIVNGLCFSFVAALNVYEKDNGVLPESVIIFRDGVGDGQLPVVMNYEIPQFQAAATRAFTNFNLKLTFIVVQKRINTRFLNMRGNEGDNPGPGTIIDHTITRKNMYDFFLVSQSVRQGTVSPTHYIVVKDDSEYRPDILQRLSYKLTFLYYNWPGTIRTPAVCQYAHKLAYLVGQNIRRAPAEELATKLFYL